MTYISADELKKHWGTLDFELLNFIRDGLSAYDLIGRRTITDSEVAYEKEETIDEFRQRLFLRERKHEIERIEKNNSAEYAINAHRLINESLLDSKLPPPEIYDEEKVRKRVEIRIAEEYNQLPSFPVVPRNRRLIPAELNDFDLHKLLNEIKTFQFKTQEINRFAHLHGLKQITEIDPTEDEQAPGKELLSQETRDISSLSSVPTDPEAFVCSLQVSYVDNTEVKFQYKGKRMKYTCESSEFRDSSTKEWQTFLEILEAKKHFYSLGPAHYFNKEIKQKVRNKIYDNRLNLLKEINKKLISFLTKHYNVKFPRKFKLYKRLPAEGKGVYSFKFQIPSGKPSYKTKEQALKCYTILVRNSASEDEIQQAALEAMEAGATKDEIIEIVQDILPSHPEYNGILYEQEKEDDIED